PAVFMTLKALPLTPNGKVDRRALPQPEFDRRSRDQSRDAPQTPLHELLAGIWACVLGVDDVGIYDNFFELGGHSLLAMQVMVRIQESLSINLPVRSLFEVPTISGLAERIDREKTVAKPELTPSLQPAPSDGQRQLSFAQERLWFLDQMDPGSGAYNIPCTLRLDGPLNVAALEKCLREIVRRHEVLRTRLPARDGRPVPTLGPETTFRVEMSDLRHVPENEREGEALRLAGEESRHPFEL